MTHYVDNLDTEIKKQMDDVIGSYKELLLSFEFLTAVKIFFEVGSKVMRPLLEQKDIPDMIKMEIRSALKQRKKFLELVEKAGFVEEIANMDKVLKG